MTTVRRFSVVCLLVGLAVTGGLGCAQANRAFSERSCTLADHEASLPPGVELPPGFYPLARQSDQANEEDHYNGWPRYIVSEWDDMIMVYVPSMTLVMGGGTGLDEKPARTISVNHFYIDLHEVSNAQFNRFYQTAVRGCRKCGADWHPDHPITALDPDYDGAMGCPWRVSKAYAEYWRPSWTNHHPVRNVSWWEASSYARWAHRQLPTEAQWEAAARGDDQRLFPWGNEKQSDVTRYLCNYQTGRDDFDGYEFTAPVLSYAGGVSPFGVYQMAGNVWEWCADWYDPGRYAYPSIEDPATGLDRGFKPFGDRNYPNPIDKDIREARIGPLRGSERVIRGGSFADPIELCRVDARAAARPDTHQYNIGFRCVLPLPPVSAQLADATGPRG